MKTNLHKKFWNNFAKKYDRFIDRHASHIYKKSLLLLKQELKTSDMVLEVGTGTGIIAHAIVDQVKHIVATDYSEEMINLAAIKKMNSDDGKIEFQVADVMNMPFPDRHFTCTIASNVFHLLPEPEKALKELKRLMTDDGKIILPTFCHGEHMKARIISAFMSLSGFKAQNKWSAEEFKEFIVKAGFTIQKEEIIQDKIPLSFIVASKFGNNG